MPGVHHMVAPLQSPNKSCYWLLWAPSSLDATMPVLIAVFRFHGHATLHSPRGLSSCSTRSSLLSAMHGFLMFFFFFFFFVHREALFSIFECVYVDIQNIVFTFTIISRIWLKRGRSWCLWPATLKPEVTV